LLFLFCSFSLSNCFLPVFLFILLRSLCAYFFLYFLSFLPFIFLFSPNKIDCLFMYLFAFYLTTLLVAHTM
jgi:hypothetical protein